MQALCTYLYLQHPWSMDWLQYPGSLCWLCVERWILCKYCFFFYRQPITESLNWLKSIGLYGLYVQLQFCVSFRRLMKTGKMMNRTITTMWKTVLKWLFGGGEKQENGMTCTVKTKGNGFVRFEEVKRPKNTTDSFFFFFFNYRILYQTIFS